MLDGAVLASGIHRLKDHQQRVRILGVQLVLLLGELLHAVLEQLGASDLSLMLPVHPES